MTDNEIFEAVKQRFTDPKVMDLLRAGLADKGEMEDVKRAIRYGEASMRNPILRDKLYKIFDRLLNVVKDDSTTRQMVKQDLRKLQKGDSDMSEDLNTANVAKAVKHDCVTHVVHEDWGMGECIPTMHTLSEDGVVTHYDIMFAHGIERNVSILDEKVKSERRRMHEHAPANMEEEVVTPEGGEANPGKASRKDLKMPLEKLKAIMEKKKQMLKGKMEEEVEQVNEGANKNTYADQDAASHPNATAKHLDKFSTHKDAAVRQAVARNPNATAKHLDTLSKDKDPGVRQTVASHPNATARHLDTLSGDKHPGVRQAVAEHPKATSEHLDKLSGDKHPEVRQTVAEHPNATAKHLDKLYRDKSSNVRYHVAKHPNATAKHLAALSKDEDSDVRSAARRKKTMKEEAKAHTIPKTKRERDLAALAPPHKLITHADVLAGRGVKEEQGDRNMNNKKKTMKEFVEQLAESLHLAEAKASGHKGFLYYDDAGNLKGEHHTIEGVTTEAGRRHAIKQLRNATKEAGHRMGYHEDRHIPDSGPQGISPRGNEKKIHHPSVEAFVKHHLKTEIENAKP